MQGLTPGKTLTLLFLLFLCRFSTLAQLTADFNADVMEGCSPLKVKFTDMSVGISASTVYEWDFGNGNKSSLQHPSSIFYGVKSYEVSLTIKDGTKTARKTLKINVFPKPDVDFKAVYQKGCTPLPVEFSSIAQTGAGNVTSYTWDFGDGYTEQAFEEKISHTYLSYQPLKVSLTIQNEYGCINTITKEKIVELLPGVEADFDADKVFLCRVTDPVKLINNSTGGGTLSWLWDFGDGTTSAGKDASHIFNKNGVYSVQLIAKNNFGCTDTVKKSNFINVANFKTQIEQPPLICHDKAIEFANTSFPNADKTQWYLENKLQDEEDYNRKVAIRFPLPGEYKLKLIAQYGTCFDTLNKVLSVKETPKLDGFIADQLDSCGFPAKYILRDTSAGAVKWEWDLEYIYYQLPSIDGFSQSIAHTFTENRKSGLNALTIYNKDGCAATAIQYYFPYMPEVTIVTLDSGTFKSCEPFSKKFGVDTKETIIKYLWKFGDGQTSTLPSPEHTYSKYGKYLVSLEYLTDKGCSGVVQFHREIVLLERIIAAFTAVGDTVICGNTVKEFRRLQNENWSIHDYWLVNGVYSGTAFYNIFYYTFPDSGKYTISLVTYNDGCHDTLTKVNYITVQPLFPAINAVTNSCDNAKRNEVTFTQSSRYAKKWIWDFGDGKTQTFTTEQKTVKHVYENPGKYKVFLTVSNDYCTLVDSTYAYVMNKQYPTLTADKIDICGNEDLEFTIGNLETTTYDGAWVSHYFHKWEYKDGTPFNGEYDHFQNFIHPIPYTGKMRGFEKGKDSIRLITYESHFQCLDTTNYIPIKVYGAISNFDILNTNPCIADIVKFRDKSVSTGSRIVKWMWDFGDGTTHTSVSSGNVDHQFSYPGTFNVRLTVQDSSGCSAISQTNKVVNVKGPKAAFTVADVQVDMNTPVQFYNHSVKPADGTTTFIWKFGDGSGSIEDNPVHSYSKSGAYKVTLFAKNTSTGCTDSASLLLNVDNFSAGYSFRPEFITVSSCPPVKVSFENSSENYKRLEWDFGDGVTAVNVVHPSHIYTKAGKYIVRLLVTGPGGIIKTIIDTVKINEPVAKMETATAMGCVGNELKFWAPGMKQALYTWDPGDGNLISSTDSVFNYIYRSVGTFQPRLISEDANGCMVAAENSRRVTIDSLYLNFGSFLSSICTPKQITFAPSVSTASGLDESLISYKWNFGTGNPADTSNLKNPTFIYNAPRDYNLLFSVKTTSGCSKTIAKTITAREGLGGIIEAEAEVCEGSTVVFKGKTLISGSPTWKWIFEDGSTSSLQTAPGRLYAQPGKYIIRLVVSNGSCADTAIHQLNVVKNPEITISEKMLTLCAGSTASIVASGGVSYLWTPAGGINVDTGATIIVTGTEDKQYNVQVTNASGCTSHDQIQVKVINRNSINLTPDVKICEGEKIQLIASGLHHWEWIQNTATLSAANIPNPFASPVTSTLYTVVGTDEANCFSDTATVMVTVAGKPGVNAGVDVQVMAGEAYPLNASAVGNIISYSWAPGTFLSCTDCEDPVAKPTQAVQYVLTVTNADGCKARDTVNISLMCADSRVHIPDAFTPDNDGLNDFFSVSGQGITKVNYFRIYNRFGEIIFEKKNYDINTSQSSWDGSYKGRKVPAGTYIYMTELQCNDKSFIRKGTVTVILH
jgi:gliding motility-associated-like protein